LSKKASCLNQFLLFCTTLISIQAFGNITIADTIGLGTYNLDSHCTQYVVGSNGYLATDGGMSILVEHPYPISYRAIVPRVEECENLLVPACLSATHVAYSSIRIESTLMILGQSAATAASLAIDLSVSVQDLPYETLRQQLLADGQILDFRKF
jgi:hypothetical protein